jgi:fructose-bisphosphate aldolase class 1
MTASAFTRAKVIAVILFEGTIDGQVRSKPVPRFLLEKWGVVPFVKIFKGLEEENREVSLMKQIPQFGASSFLDRGRADTTVLCPLHSLGSSVAKGVTVSGIQ